MQRLLILVCAAAALGGCASTRQGYLLKIDNGQRGTVVFHDGRNSNQGSVAAQLGNGEQCQGQFNSIPDQVTRNIESPQEITSEDTQVGVAILQCASNHVVRCNFSREGGGPGSGQCLDNLGQKYSLSF